MDRYDCADLHYINLIYLLLKYLELDSLLKYKADFPLKIAEVDTKGVKG